MAMNSTRRKLAIATWKAPAEGNIYGKLTIDAEQAISFCEHLRQTTGEKVSITHLVGKAIAMALRAAPGLNGRIFLDRYIPFDTVDVTFLVALEDGADLAKAKVSDADKLSVDGIAASLRQRAEKLRGGKDPDFEKSKGTLRMLPVLFIRPLVWLVGWLASAAGLSIPALGVERFPFGSCVITSVGMFGLDEGFAPPTPFARVPLLVLVGAVKQAPTVVDGAIVARPQLTVTATVDHRFVDGMELGRLAKIVRATLEDPWKHLGVERPGVIEG